MNNSIPQLAKTICLKTFGEVTAISDSTECGIKRPSEEFQASYDAIQVKGK